MRPHVVVDGSNIATEGRTKPSLAQLNEAVLTFMKEFPGTVVTVVVDATFGYRIDRKEQVEFEQAIDANELVTPPAGAVGRGDAFVLGIADKVEASVLSNDSYQEFHGQYPWLFNEGRLIGGKPVPHVGWVFVERLPVRGPVSRKALKAGGKLVAKTPRRASAAASAPLPVPKSPPPRASAAKTPPRAPAQRPPVARPVAPAGEVSRQHANELLPFLSFVESNPIGTTVRAVVEAYSAHGATVTIGDVHGYVPLRLLATPTPRSARDHLKIGQTVSLVVAGFTPARRSIELGVQALVPTPKKRAVSKTGAVSKQGVTKSGGAATKRTAAPARTPAAKSAASKSAASKTVAKVPAKKSAAKASPARKAPARKAVSKAAPVKKTPSKATAKVSPARKAPSARTSVRDASTGRSRGRGR